MTDLITQSGILKRSFIDHPDLVLSESSQKWLKTCPDLQNMIAHLHNAHILSQRKPCAECGEVYAVGEMRIDDFTSFPCNELICRDCAELFCEPTVGNDVGLDINEEWKPTLRIADLQHDDVKNEVPLIIQFKTTKEKIGTVTDYNPRAHTGVVRLDAFGEKELGSLDWNCEVATEAGVVVGPTGPRPNMKLKTEEIAYEANLKDILKKTE